MADNQQPAAPAAPGAQAAAETQNNAAQPAGAPAPREVVQADEVLASVGPPGSIKMPPEQQAAVNLAWGVGLTIAAITLILLVYFVWTVPAGPSISASAETKTLIDNYKTLYDVTYQAATGLFETIVVKALLPVFLALLGYIFGSRAKGS